MMSRDPSPGHTSQRAPSVSSERERETLTNVLGATRRLDLTVPAETSALGGLRLELAMVLADSGASMNVVEELVLAASELVSNVISHTDHDDVSIRLDKDSGEYLLSVSGADGLETVPAQLPAPSPADGRGLAIVHEVTDRVELVDEDGQRWIRCASAV